MQAPEESSSVARRHMLCRALYTSPRALRVPLILGVLHIILVNVLRNCSPRGLVQDEEGDHEAGRKR